MFPNLQVHEYRTVGFLRFPYNKAEYLSSITDHLGWVSLGCRDRPVHSGTWQVKQHP